MALGGCTGGEGFGAGPVTPPCMACMPVGGRVPAASLCLGPGWSLAFLRPSQGSQEGPHLFAHLPPVPLVTASAPRSLLRCACHNLTGHPMRTAPCGPDVLVHALLLLLVQGSWTKSTSRRSSRTRHARRRASTKTPLRSHSTRQAQPLAGSRFSSTRVHLLCAGCHNAAAGQLLQVYIRLLCKCAPAVQAA